MKMKALITFFLILVVFVGHATSKRVVKNFTFKGKTIKYAIQLPSDHNPEKSYPVMIGPSEVEGEESQSFYWRGTQETYGWILVDYQIYNAQSRVGEIKAFLGHLKSIYKVEGNKFHTVCFSANSASIFDLVMEMPGYFKSITGVAGNPSTTDKDKLGKLKGVKVNFIVGENDSYWLDTTKKRYQLLKEIGVDTEVEYIKNGPHVITEIIGEGFLRRSDRLR